MARVSHGKRSRLQDMGDGRSPQHRGFSVNEEGNNADERRRSTRPVRSWMGRIIRFDCGIVAGSRRGSHRLRTGRTSRRTSGSWRHPVPDARQQRAGPTGHHLGNPRPSTHGLPDQMGQCQHGIPFLQRSQRTRTGQLPSSRRREHAHARQPDAGRELQGSDPGPLLQRGSHGSRAERPVDGHRRAAGQGLTHRRRPPVSRRPTSNTTA